MPQVRLPLSGNVTQSIWMALMSPFNNQIGLINIDLGRSSAPEVEEQVLREVGSYGKQLGRIGDALTMLLQEPLCEAEHKAIDAVRSMLGEIADIKHHHKRVAMRS